MRGDEKFIVYLYCWSILFAAFNNKPIERFWFDYPVIVFSATPSLFLETLILWYSRGQINQAAFVKLLGSQISALPYRPSLRHNKRN